jgi:general nucleoside transport system ATP-binding protein
MTETPIILEMKGICKTFGTSAALKDVDFELNAREIHGLLGGNGAGKTTLMNVLYGLYREDSGTVHIHGQKVVIRSPKDAIAHGIGMVHQHFQLIKSYNVIHNIILGTEIRNKLTMNLEEEEKKLKELMTKFGLDVDLYAVVENLPMGVRQKVEILKALYRGVGILILDEPTTNLTPQEVDSLFQSLRIMVKEGLSIVFITHKLKEVLAVCDRITVLRNGQNVVTLNRDESSEEAFVKGMVGDEMDLSDSVIFSGKGLSNENRTACEECALQLIDAKVVNKEGITTLDTVNLSIRRGEIFGIAGVANNGQHELAEIVIGIQALSTGQMMMNGQVVEHSSTRSLLENGVAYIPEDSLVDGFLPKASVAYNMILGFQYQQPYSSKNIMHWKEVERVSRQLIKEFHIKTLGPQEVGANLSGGNIQRVMIARAFSRPAKLLVAHNPTRGLDIPSTDFVYTKILKGRKEGMATLLISENLDELLLMCDRIAVIYRGALLGVLERGKFEKYEIGRLMSGIRNVN